MRIALVVAFTLAFAACEKDSPPRPTPTASELATAKGVGAGEIPTADDVRNCGALGIKLRATSMRAYCRPELGGWVLDTPKP